MGYDVNLTPRKHHAYRVFTDQHGRKWGCLIDKRTSDPCSTWEAKFDAPILPPKSCMRTNTDPEKPLFVFIDYENWRGQLVNAGREYHNELLRKGVAIQGDSFDVENPGLQVRQAVGGAPYPPVLFKDGTIQTPVVDALQDGQEYVLGIRAFDPKNPEDEELKNYVIPKVESRRTWGRKKKEQAKARELTMQEAG